MNTVDKEFPEYMEDIIHIAFQVLSAMIITIIYSPWSIILIVIMVLACYVLRKIYVQTSHSLKHLEATSKSLFVPSLGCTSGKQLFPIHLKLTIHTYFGALIRNMMIKIPENLIFKVKPIKKCF